MDNSHVNSFEIDYRKLIEIEQMIDEANALLHKHYDSASSDDGLVRISCSSQIDDEKNRERSISVRIIVALGYKHDFDSIDEAHDFAYGFLDESKKIVAEDFGQQE